MKERNRLFYVAIALSLGAFACNSGPEAIDKIPTSPDRYDPSKPTTVTRVIPDYGIIDDNFIVEGNFPGGLEDMKVYFGTREAVLLSTDGKSIVGLVPKQPDGYNNVSVVIGQDSLAPDGMVFNYSQSRSVKTIAGQLGTDLWMADEEYRNVDINAVTFGEVHYVGTVKGRNDDIVVMVETGWGNRVFIMSMDDGLLQKVSSPGNAGAPAVPSTRDKFYAVKMRGDWDGNDHAVYVFTPEESWAGAPTGIVITNADVNDTHGASSTFGETDDILYWLDNRGRIAEIDLANKSYKIFCAADQMPPNIDQSHYGGEIKPADGLAKNLPNNFGTWQDSYITYSHYHQCFFASFASQHAIYRLDKNADGSWTSTLYAGNNGSGFTAGNRLSDAQFNSPHGMVVNSMGEIFVVNRNGNYISKIFGNAVELVAGKPGVNNPLANGEPLESVFNNPRNLAIDFEGNYYVAGGNDRTVRKLSIE